MTPEAPIVLHSIIFNEEGVQVSYVERAENTGTPVVMIKTLNIPAFSLPSELEEMMEAAAGLIDAALLLRRNPPETIPARVEARGQSPTPS